MYSSLLPPYSLPIGYSDAGVPFAVSLNSLPIGMRDNNPGNLKYFRGAEASFPGLIGPAAYTDQGDPQMKFQSAASGMAGAARLALRKFDAGKVTINGIIAGPGGWTPGYYPAARNIAATMGIKPDQKINLRDPGQMQSFLRALVTQEHGPAAEYYSPSLYAYAANAVLGTNASPLPGAGIANVNSPTLRQGMSDRSAPVSDLQRQLRAQGFDPGRVDGVYGTRTAAAVRAFQRASGLPQIDGVAGPQTLGALVARSVSPGIREAANPAGGTMVAPVSATDYGFGRFGAAMSGALPGAAATPAAASGPAPTGYPTVSSFAETPDRAAASPLAIAARPPPPAPTFPALFDHQTQAVAGNPASPPAIMQRGGLWSSIAPADNGVGYDAIGGDVFAPGAGLSAGNGSPPPRPVASNPPVPPALLSPTPMARQATALQTSPAGRLATAPPDQTTLARLAAMNALASTPGAASAPANAGSAPVAGGAPLSLNAINGFLQPRALNPQLLSGDLLAGSRYAGGPFVAQPLPSVPRTRDFNDADFVGANPPAELSNAVARNAAIASAYDPLAGDRTGAPFAPGAIAGLSLANSQRNLADLGNRVGNFFGPNGPIAGASNWVRQELGIDSAPAAPGGAPRVSPTSLLMNMLSPPATSAMAAPAPAGLPSLAPYAATGAGAWAPGAAGFLGDPVSAARRFDAGSFGDMPASSISIPQALERPAVAPGGPAAAGITFSGRPQPAAPPPVPAGWGISSPRSNGQPAWGGWSPPGYGAGGFVGNFGLPLGVYQDAFAQGSGYGGGYPIGSTYSPQ